MKNELRMQDELITFETAKLANEKGFKNGVVPRGFKVGIEIEVSAHFEPNCYLRPTQSLLQKWLREKHEILVTPYANACGYCVELHYSPKMGGTHIKDFSFLEETENGCFETYEQALEKGLQEALKLIE